MLNWISILQIFISFHDTKWFSDFYKCMSYRSTILVYRTKKNCVYAHKTIIFTIINIANMPFPRSYSLPIYVILLKLLPSSSSLVSFLHTLCIFDRRSEKIIAFYDNMQIHISSQQHRDCCCCCSHSLLMPINTL